MLSKDAVRSTSFLSELKNSQKRADSIPSSKNSSPPPPTLHAYNCPISLSISSNSLTDTPTIALLLPFRFISP